MIPGLEAADGPLRPFVHIGVDGPQAVGGPGGPGRAPLPAPGRDQQLFGEPAPQPGPPLENTGAFVNLGSSGPQLVSNQPSFSTFVDEQIFSDPLPLDQGPGPVPESAGLGGGRPFVNLGPGSGPLGLESAGPGHQAAFVDLGSPGGPGNIFDNGQGGLARSLAVGQGW